MSDDPPARWRLFVAAPVPAAQGEALWRSLEPVRLRHPQARWTPIEQYHATLVFLGGIEPQRVPVIEQAMRTVAARQRRLLVMTGPADGRLDDRRSGVAWLRLAAGSAELRRLAIELDQLIGSGVYVRSSPRPHLTLARRVDERLLADLRAAAATLGFSWPVERLVLFRSHTLPTGSRYESLAECALTGRVADP